MFVEIIRASTCLLMHYYVQNILACIKYLSIYTLTHLTSRRTARHVALQNVACLLSNKCDLRILKNAAKIAQSAAITWPSQVSILCNSLNPLIGR